MLLPSLLTLTLALAPLLTPGLGLMLREVTVPPFILAGDTASLGCMYDAQVRHVIQSDTSDTWHLRHV